MKVWLLVTLIINGQLERAEERPRPDLQSCLTDAARLLATGALDLENEHGKDGRTVQYQLVVACKIADSITGL
jgi:hypothetical protein